MTRLALFSCIFIAAAISPRLQAEMVINELFFTADLSDIYGAGAGFYDPSTDLLQLMGLDWVGATVIENESRRQFEEDPFNPGVFYTTMVIRGQEGDSTKWKCKAEPEAHFFNWGWEISPDYWYTIQEEGHYEEITLKPNIFPIKPPIEQSVTVLFQVDMRNAVNYYTQEKIDPATVEWVGLKGQNSVLGAWAGVWMPSDTLGARKTLHVLRDHGRSGDKVAGDYIFSAFVEFPAGNEGGPGLFKYGAYYPGALEANNGSNPLDNEMHGTDHWINIIVDGQTEILNRFGVIQEITSSVAAPTENIPRQSALEPNYPNPFNPTTTIPFILDQRAHVVLSVHNLQGQVVATLVDQEIDAGAHTVAFNARNLPAGLYICRFSADDIQYTRKMILVK